MEWVGPKAFGNAKPVASGNYLPRELKSIHSSALTQPNSPACPELGLLVKQPDEVGGTSTQSAYLVVTDADAVYASAKAGGARIAMEIRDEDYGGCGFSCYDLEGHLWSFGTYDP